jgi:hypothetical protein
MCKRLTNGIILFYRAYVKRGGGGAPANPRAAPSSAMRDIAAMAQTPPASA